VNGSFPAKSSESGHPPSLIVVTGRPGSGKTTLAHILAKAVRCPAICRDEVKEGLVSSLGDVQQSFEDLQRRTYDAFFNVIELLLSHRVTLIAEAAFQHERWAQRLEALRQIADIRIVLCVVDAQRARARHIARGLEDPERERFHGDRPVVAAREGRELPIGEYDPPHLDVPILEVDTTDGYRPAFESIVSFARQRFVDDNE
jgi:predicted kinase